MHRDGRVRTEKNKRYGVAEAVIVLELPSALWEFPVQGLGHSHLGGHRGGVRRSTWMRPRPASRSFMRSALMTPRALDMSAASRYRLRMR